MVESQDKNQNNDCEDCPPEKCFWATNGEIYKNCKELAAGLKKMSKETFTYHVNTEKNDFANWIKDVFGDACLAKEIANAKSPLQMSRKITSHLKKLKKENEKKQK